MSVFREVWGAGENTALMWYSQNYRSLRDLRTAADSGKLSLSWMQQDMLCGCKGLCCVDVKGYSADGKGYSADVNKGYSVDIEGYTVWMLRAFLCGCYGLFCVDVTGYSADVKGYFADGYFADVKGYFADVKDYSVDVTGYSVRILRAIFFGRGCSSGCGTSRICNAAFPVRRWSERSFACANRCECGLRPPMADHI
eukprot:7710271-Pyramimonas_sp.AAC.1